MLLLWTELEQRWEQHVWKWTQGCRLTTQSVWRWTVNWTHTHRNITVTGSLKAANTAQKTFAVFSWDILLTGPAPVGRYSQFVQKSRNKYLSLCETGLATGLAQIVRRSCHSCPDSQTLGWWMIGSVWICSDCRNSQETQRIYGKVTVITSDPLVKMGW